MPEFGDAVRLAEPLAPSHPGLGDKLRQMADDPDPQVRFQLALTLDAALAAPAAALARILARDPAEVDLQTAVFSSVAGCRGEVFWPSSWATRITAPSRRTRRAARTGRPDRRHSRCSGVRGLGECSPAWPAAARPTVARRGPSADGRPGEVAALGPR